MATDLGKLSDTVYQKIAEVAQARAALEQQERELHDLENQLMQAMEQAGTNLCRGSLATISISEVTSPKIVDWSKFESYVYRHKLLHLLHKRVSSVAYRELKEGLGRKSVPGLEEHTYQRLNVRKVNPNG